MDDLIKRYIKTDPLNEIRKSDVKGLISVSKEALNKIADIRRSKKSMIV